MLPIDTGMVASLLVCGPMWEIRELESDYYVRLGTTYHRNISRYW